MAAEPKPEDLREYDAVLTAASRLTFRLKTMYSGKLAVSTFHVDADTNKDAFSILVNHSPDPAKRGKNLANESPWGEFYAVVALGDGSDGRIVQTITRAGTVEYTLSGGRPEIQSMDRGDACTVTGSLGFSAVAMNNGSDPLCKCQANEKAIKVERASGTSVRLAATPERNKAMCWRWWCEACCVLPTFCSGPVCINCCCSIPNLHYELQDSSNTHLGGALYTQRTYTFCYECLCTNAMPHGSYIDLGTAPLEARRDVVAMIAGQTGMISSAPASA